MDIRKISPTFAVGPQISATDMETLKAQGFKAVICNRPDGEGVDQPAFQEIEAAALKLGIVARHVPVVGGDISEKDVADFGEALQTLPRPLLAYCRSGARSSTLWSLWEASKQPSAETF